MKTFVLCRHAKSDWPEGVTDEDRPLKKRGINDAHDLGKILENRYFIPDLLVSSHANRAHTTAQIIAKQLNLDGKIVIAPSIYHEGAGNLIELIKELPGSANTVMLFGHNPTMERAVQFLLQTSRTVSMPTCAMACFEIYADEWQSLMPHNVNFRWMLIPHFKRKES